MVDRSAAVPTPDWSVLADELRERDADAFVHVGDGSDPDYRYLAGDVDSDRRLGVVRLQDDDSTIDTSRTLHVVPDRLRDGCQELFAGDEVIAAGNRHMGRAIVDVLEEGAADGPVLAVPAIPHDAALYVDRAGYELQSTDAIAVTRRRKTDRERAAMTSGQRAAHAGIERARDRLAATEGELVDGDDEPTRERLQRAVDEAIVAAGAQPAGGTTVRQGTDDERTAADRTDPTALRADEPIVLSCSPRTPAGYHGWLARTIVVDGDGGWERRAHVAVTNARQAALAVLDAGTGVTIDDVTAEANAELTAYGFGHDDSGERVRVRCHGVGLARHERPTPRYDGTLQNDDVVGLEIGVMDPDNGRVTLSDLVAVREDDSRVLVDVSTSLAP